MTKILLVEDDKSIVESLKAFLQGEGFEVFSCSGQLEALELLQKQEFSIALLDVSIADGNGFSLCRAIKSTYAIPVIFLTASDDEYSTVTGFEIGADDFIPKPYRPRELLMRIKNILRLTGKADAIIKLGNVTIDTVKGNAMKNNEDLYLSALEYKLLLVFINNRGKVLSRTQLLQSIWDIAGDFVNDNTLTVYIKRLRDKIEDNPKEPKVIKTVRGLGYKVD